VKEAGPLGIDVAAGKPAYPAANRRTVHIEVPGCCPDTVAEFDNVLQTFDSKGKRISFIGMRKPGMYRYRFAGAFTEKPANREL